MGSSLEAETVRIGLFGRLAALLQPQPSAFPVGDGYRGTAEDITRAVLYLAGDDSSFVTGTTLVVDGGGLAG